jgi:Uncharacterised protein family (UPF0220)
VGAGELRIVNMINKENIKGDGSAGSFSADGDVIWRARVFLFVGFALMAGGLAGSVVSRLFLGGGLHDRVVRLHAHGKAL